MVKKLNRADSGWLVDVTLDEPPGAIHTQLAEQADETPGQRSSNQGAFAAGYFEAALLERPPRFAAATTDELGVCLARLAFRGER